MIRLCSGSETRAKQLTNAGVAFIQSPVDYDEEQIVASSPKNFVYQATRGKYEAALKKYDPVEIPILVADSVVTAQGQILRKAKCVDDARNILMTQSEQTTSIITCLIYKRGDLEFIDISSTDYLFAKFDPDDLESYLASGLWRGKAGACMVEGFCKKYITSVQGYESCALGLTLDKLLPFL